MKKYLLAAALGNGNLFNFVELVKEMKGFYLVFHFLIVSFALYFPVMYRVSRVSPWDFYSRLAGDNFTGLIEKSLGAESGENSAAPQYGAGEDIINSFNSSMLRLGYGRDILLPALALLYVILLITQAVFYLLAALFLKLHRMLSSPLRFKERIGIFIMSSTVTVICAALFGLFLPVVHIIVFYLAETALGFYISKKYDTEKTALSLRGAEPR
jgi:hypothetical protein